MITVNVIDANTKQVLLNDGTVSVVLSNPTGDPGFSWDNAFSATSPLDVDGTSWYWDIPSQSYLQNVPSS